MVSASQLLGIGSSGGGSAQIESTVDSGSSLTAGQTVSINSSGEFVPFDGTLPLFGIATSDAAGGATTTVTSVEAFAGTVSTFANASDLNGSVTEIDLSTAAIDTGNTGSLSGNNGIQFNSNGSQVITLDNTSLREYNLSPNFDLTSASIGNTVSLSGQDSTMQAFCFGAAGTKMYAAGLANNRIYEYDVGTAYNINTLSFVNFFSVPSESIRGISISPDGKYMLAIFDTSDAIRMYTLGTAYDITTASQTSTTTLSGTWRDCYLGAAGDKVYLTNTFGTNTVREYSLGTAYDVSTLNTTPVNTITSSFVEAFAVSEDKTKLLIHPVAQIYDNTPSTSTITIDSGSFVYSDNSGNLTTADTGNFVGFKATPTQLIFTQEPT